MGRYKFIKLGVCGNDSHCNSLVGSCEAVEEIKGKTYVISGCELCVDEEIQRLKRRKGNNG